MDNRAQLDLSEDSIRVQNGLRLELALTKMTLAAQELEREKVFGRLSIELDFVEGVIQRVRRVIHVTEK